MATKIAQSVAVAGFASELREKLRDGGPVVVQVLERLENSLNLGLSALSQLLDPTNGFIADSQGNLTISQEYIRRLTERFDIADPPPNQAITAVGNTIYPTGRWVKLTNASGNKTLTSVPTIPAGVDGQDLELLNLGPNNVVLQDFGTLAGSNIQLATGVSKTLATGQVILLRYNVNLGRWIAKA